MTRAINERLSTYLELHRLPSANPSAKSYSLSLSLTISTETRKLSESHEGIESWRELASAKISLGETKSRIFKLHTDYGARSLISTFARARR